LSDMCADLGGAEELTLRSFLGLGVKLNFQGTKFTHIQLNPSETETSLNPS